MAPLLRILTLNTWKNEGNYDRRLSAMEAGLALRKPDITLLQECFRCEEPIADTAGMLARRLGYNLAYEAARRKRRLWGGREVLCESGLSILSRFPSGGGSRLDLSSSPAGGERIALAGAFDVQGTALVVACVHFSHLKREERLRQLQIEETLSWLGERWPEQPWVLGGDFNCAPDSEEVRQAAASSRRGFVNALPALRVSGPTCPLPENPRRPGRQIDQIWLSPSPGGSLRLVRGGTGMSEPDPRYGVYASDHAAVWADIELA